MTPMEWAAGQTVGTVFGKALLLAVCARVNASGAAAVTDVDLARDTEMHVHSVQHHLEVLERKGLLRVDRSDQLCRIQLPAAATVAP